MFAIALIALIAIVIVLSALLAWADIKVTYQVVEPPPISVEETVPGGSTQPSGGLPDASVQEGEYTVREETAAIQSLLSADGIRFLFTSFVASFRNFAAVAIILVVIFSDYIGRAYQTALWPFIGFLIMPLTTLAYAWFLIVKGEVVDKIPEDRFVERVKNREPGVKLMGFGHRVYKNYDPRARIIKQVAEDVFKVTGLNPLLEIAVELERIALEDDYFISHKLYPNVDFYSGIIYEAMGFPTEMFPVLFAIGRMPGWLAQWEENLSDPEQRIARPRQIYVGPGERHVERD
jgi:hypothetical protein